MKSKIGLWIDHRQAVIVRVFEAGEETSRIISNLPKRVRFSGASSDRSETNPHDATSEYKRERRFQGLWNHYYDEVIAQLTDSDSIFIMGPGEAKIELQKRLENESQAILVIEAADKMTENQIVAKIRQHFQETEHRLSNDK
jgi:hypothetical protein